MQQNKKRFYKNSKKQSEIFNLLNSSFRFDGLIDFTESLHLFVFKNFSGVFEYDKIPFYSKRIFELTCLYIIELSNEWEKFVQRILEICNVEHDTKKNKENSYGRYYKQKLLNEFKSLNNSTLLNSIDILKKIANNLKHNIDKRENILKQHEDALFEIQNKILEENETFLKEKNNIEESLPISEDLKIKILSYIKEMKKHSENKIEIWLQYMITSFWLLVRRWILTEFSFSEKKVIIGFDKMPNVYFSEKEEKLIKQNLERKEQIWNTWNKFIQNKK